jgi:hypothetical protein
LNLASVPVGVLSEERLPFGAVRNSPFDDL